MDEPFDRLIARWLRGRSIARGLPQPVRDRGGWRVDTGSATERCRYVFADASQDLRDLAHETLDPAVALRACLADTAMRGLLPTRWSLQPAAYVMLGPPDIAPAAPSAGYVVELRVGDEAAEVSVETADGELAASGYAAETDNVFVYDRIVTTPAHQRRGLGRVVMARLGEARRSDRSQPLLVATEQGRALYRTLGWREIAPYASAVIPAPVA